MTVCVCAYDTVRVRARVCVHACARMFELLCTCLCFSRRVRLGFLVICAASGFGGIMDEYIL